MSSRFGQVLCAGGQLADLAHEYGVPLRCLGAVAALTGPRHVKEALLVEMLARAARDVLWLRLRRTQYNDVSFARRIVAHMLSALFSKPRRVQAAQTTLGATEWWKEVQGFDI
jgi:hypothetical protein